MLSLATDFKLYFPIMEKIDKINSALCKEHLPSSYFWCMEQFAVYITNHFFLLILFSHLQNAMPAEQCIKPLANMTECPWKG